MLDFIAHLCLTLLSGIGGFLITFLFMYLVCTFNEQIHIKKTGQYSSTYDSAGLLTVFIIAPTGAIMAMIGYIVSIFI